MSLTLLFDLDNTLLSNGMDNFLPAYLHLLSNYVSDLTDKNRFTKIILENIQRAIANKKPNRTLLEIFECSFFSQLGLPKEVLQPRLESFYSDVFSDLKSLTEPHPEAITLIDECFKRGYHVVIATNPLFPLAAVEHRLTWAGLPTTQYPFERVASLETFHFAKPNPAFFAEALAQIGWPEGPVVVIGDDPINDIHPSKDLGFSSYHIVDQPVPSTDPRHGGGSLQDFLPWLDNTDLETLLPRIDSSAGLRSILSAVPSAIHTSLAGMTQPHYGQKPDSGEWSLTQVLCHLRDVELEVQQPRIHEVLTSENPFLIAENTDAWAETRNYQRQDGPQALEDFLQARIQTLEQIERFSTQDWQRTARHTIFGRTDLFELIRFMAEHDQLHLHQILSARESLNHFDITMG